VGEIFYLNLRENDLYGWESKKNKFLVKSIIKGIKNGDEFPPVSVHKTITNRFFISKIKKLDNGVIDGGHHRAIAHYKMKKLLKCELFDGEPALWFDYVHIKDIKLERDRIGYNFQKQKFPDYI